MTPVELRVPGDKSIAHRALIFAALARGESRISNLPDGADVASTLAMMRAFGADIERDGDRALVRGRGVESLHPPGRPIDCGNSGTTARLGIGLAAALAGTTVFTGDESLSVRPMARVADPLRASGARIELAAGDFLPATVQGGTLRAIHDRSTTISAQVKSALLLAGVAAGVPIDIGVGASRDHTERMLRRMGIQLGLLDFTREDLQRFVLRAAPPYRLAPVDLDLPGDLSSAAFLIAASLLAGVPVVIRDVGVNRTRTGFIDIVGRMGARCEFTAERDVAGEPVADVRVEPGELRGTTVARDEVVRTIDELPLVGVLAAHAEGETSVSGATELRAKESDRIQALCQNLNAIGARAEERYDGFVVHGTTRPLAGRVASHGDHRIAMAFAVLGLRPGSRIDVDDMDVARISFPGFARAIDALRPRPATGGTG